MRANAYLQVNQKERESERMGENDGDRARERDKERTIQTESKQARKSERHRDRVKLSIMSFYIGSWISAPSLSLSLLLSFAVIPLSSAISSFLSFTVHQQRTDKHTNWLTDPQHGDHVQEGGNQTVQYTRIIITRYKNANVSVPKAKTTSTVLSVCAPLLLA